MSEAQTAGLSLLLACLRKDAEADQALRCFSLRLEAEGADQETFSRLAARHGLLPLVYNRLQDSGACPTITTSLQSLFQHNARRSLRLGHVLLHILEVLEQAGVPALPIKGAVLAQQAYGDLVLRQFQDVDVLVQPADIPLALTALQAAGYNQQAPFPAHQLAWIRRGSKDLTLVQGDVAVELHWEVVEQGIGFPLPAAHFWQDRHTTSLLGRDIPTLSTENTLLLVCLHAAKHSWRQLNAVADIAYLLQRQPDGNWAGLAALAKQMGMQRLLGLGLFLAQLWCRIELPLPLENLAAANPYLEALAKHIQMSWSSPSGTQGLVGEAAFLLRLREGWLARLYYVLDQTFIPKPVDWRQHPLPLRLYPLYYVLRPVRLIKQYGFDLLFKRRQ